MESWVLFPSLLSDLGDQPRALLEEASEAWQRGNYVEASQIFHSYSKDCAMAPVVALEYADMLQAQWLDKKRAEFLDTVIDQGGVELPDATRKLLELMRAHAKLRAGGTLEESISTARIAREWLREAADGDLSELQVHGLELYYDIINNGLTQSNVLNSEQVMLFPDSGSGLIEELTAIRRRLARNNQSAAAMRFARTEFEILQAADSPVAIIVEIMAICEDQANKGGPGILLSASHTLRVALRCAKLYGPDWLVRKCIESIGKLLDALKGITGQPWQIYSPVLAFNDELDRADEKPPIERVQKLRDIAKDASSREDYASATAALFRAINAAGEWANSQGNVAAAATLRDVQAQYVTLHRDYTGLATREGSALRALFTTLAVTWKEHRTIVGQYLEFEKRHPHFEIPRISEGLLFETITAARAIQDNRLASRLLKAYSDVYEKLPMIKMDDDRRPTLTEAARSDPDLFFMEIDGVDSREETRGVRAVKMALRWAWEEVDAGVMTLTQWADIFERFTNDECRGPRDLYLADKKYDDVGSAIFSLPHGEWQDMYRKLKAWLLLPDRPPFRKARVYVLKAILGTRAYQARQRAMGKDPEPTITGEIAEYADELGSVDSLEMSLRGPQLRDVDRRKAASVQSFTVMALADQNWAHGLVTMPQLLQGLKDCDDLVADYRATNNELGTYTTLMRKGKLTTMQYKMKGGITLPASLEPYEEANRFFSEVRRNHSTIDREHPRTAITRFIDGFSHDDLCRELVLVARAGFIAAGNRFYTAMMGPKLEGESDAQKEARCRALHEEFEQGHVILRNWTQRAKARKLNDLMGVEARIPQSLLDAASEDAGAAAMLAQETELVKQLAETPFPEKLQVEDTLTQLRKQMRDNGVLKPIMGLRDGGAVTVEGIRQMLQQLPDGVVFVDFLFVDPESPQPTLLALCYRKEKVYFPARLGNLPLPQLRDKWKGILDETRPLDEPTAAAAALEELGKLLEPLFEQDPAAIIYKKLGDPPCIRNGDTIVLCPTDVLHLVPLHAASVRGAPLVERHPVVYCPSLTILHHEWQSVVSRDVSRVAPPKATVVNPLPEFYDAEAGAPPQSTASTATVRALAARLGAAYHGGFQQRAADVMGALSGTSVFHYHGHARFSPRAPLDSFLCLDSEALRCRLSDPRGERLVAGDLFDAPLAHPALATVVGCRSGVARVERGDDLLGVATGLVFAGASCVAGALWWLDDADGAEWAREFYADVLEQSAGIVDGGGENGSGRTGERRNEGRKEVEGMTGLVDLARAMQTAVRKLRFDAEGRERTPYHWAAMALNGFWWFPKLGTQSSEWTKNGAVPSLAVRSKLGDGPESAFAS